MIRLGLFTMRGTVQHQAQRCVHSQDCTTLNTNFSSNSKATGMHTIQVTNHDHITEMGDVSHSTTIQIYIRNMVAQTSVWTSTIIIKRLDLIVMFSMLTFANSRQCDTQSTYAKILKRTCEKCGVMHNETRKVNENLRKLFVSPHLTWQFSKIPFHHKGCE